MPLDTPARHDLYVGIHKALRLFMTDTLQRVGRLDLDDAADCRATLEQLRQLLGACRKHLKHENDFLHPAIEAFRPGSSTGICNEHDDHLECIAALEVELEALQSRPSPAGALHLYRRLSRFVGENLEHMLVEESRHNAVLWEGYSDAELQALHQRLIASIPPEEMQLTLRWMLPALNPAERVGLLGGMPAPVRAAVLDQIQPHLEPAAWRQLTRALGG